jgi:hypothetical protein
MSLSSSNSLPDNARTDEDSLLELFDDQSNPLIENDEDLPELNSFSDDEEDVETPYLETRSARHITQTTKFLAKYFKNPKLADQFFQTPLAERDSSTFLQQAGRVERKTRTHYRLKLVDLALNRRKVKTVLDVGPGDYEFTDAITKKFSSKTYVCDPSRSHGTMGSYYNLGDVTALDESKMEPFPRFDLICVFMTLHHLAPDKQFPTILFLQSLLTPKGVLLIKEHDVDHDSKDMLSQNDHDRIVLLEHEVWDVLGFPCNDGNIHCRRKSEWLRSFPDREVLWQKEELNAACHFYFALIAPPARLFKDKTGKKTGWISDFPIAVHDDDVKKSLEDEGWTTKQKSGYNPHDKQAAERMKVLLTLLMYIDSIFPKDQIIHVGLYFDWGRISSILKKFPERFSFVVKQTVIARQDLFRVGRASKKNPMRGDMSKCDVAITFDQYDGLTVPHVANMFRELPEDTPIYSVMNDLFGIGGISAGQCYYTDHEYVTGRTDDITVYRHPVRNFPYWLTKETAQSWPLNDPDNGKRWMYATPIRLTSGGLMKSGKIIFQLVASRTLIKGSERPQIKNTSFFEYVDIKKITHDFNAPYIARLKSVGANRVLIHREAFRKFKMNYASAPYVQWVDSAAVTHLNAFLNKDDDWNMWKTQFPDFAMRIREDTLHALLFLDKDKNIELLESYADYAKPYNDRLKRVFKGLNDGPDLPGRQVAGQGLLADVAGAIRSPLHAGAFPMWQQNIVLMFLVFLIYLGFLHYFGTFEDAQTSIITLVTDLYEMFHKYYVLMMFGMMATIMMFKRTYKTACLVKEWSTDPVWITIESLMLFQHPLMSILSHYLMRPDFTIIDSIFHGTLAAYLMGPLHLLYNLWISIPDFTVWDKFRDAYNAEDPRSAENVYGSGPVPLNDKLISMTAHPTYHLTKEMDETHDLKCYVNGILTDPVDVPKGEPQKVQTPIIFTNANNHVSTNDPYTAIHAVLDRNMIKVPKPGSKKRWDDCATQFVDHLRKVSPLPGWDRQDLTDWADSIKDTKKRRSAFQLLQQIDDGEVPYEWTGAGFGVLGDARLKTTMFPKTNETTAYKDCLGRIGLKPRTIINMPLIVQVHTQPHIKRASLLLKQALLTAFVIDDRLFWYSYAGGMNALDLSNWYEAARLFCRQTDGVAGIFMGDDSLIIDGDRIVECDYSHFDNSQSGWLIERIDRMTLSALGVPDGVIDLLEEISKGKCTYKRNTRLRRCKFVFTPGEARRCSGAPNTSLSNSIMNMIAMIMASFGNYGPQIWKDIGFTAVISVHDKIEDATFLKGMWWLTTDGTYHWGSLPSRILKIGKTLSNIKTPSEMKDAAFQVVAGIGEVDSSFPVLGAFRDKLLQLSGKVEKDLVDHAITDFGFSEHRIQNRKFSIDRPSALSVIGKRYDLSVGDIETLETTISQITSLPWYIGSEALLQFRKDY